MPAEAAKQFGVIETDEDWRIVGFEEKPAQPKDFADSSGQSERVDGRVSFQYATSRAHSDCGCRRSHFVARFWQGRFAAHHREISRVSPTTFQDENKKETLTGGTWERSTPIMKPTWTWCRFRRFSICTTRAGRCTPGSSNIRRRNSCLPIRSAWASALDSIVSRRIDHFRRARGALRSGLRRAREQLQRSGRFDRVQPREYRTAAAAFGAPSSTGT